MNSLEYEVLCRLRQGYLDTLGQDEQPTWQQKKTGKSASARQFYLAGFQDNLVRPMDPAALQEFGDGAGRELEDKMCALRSSSAMTFNILGNEEVTFSDSSMQTVPIPSGRYRIQYEYKAPTLDIDERRPAHLDALLSPERGRTFIACEMKLMEWLMGKPKMLRDKYLDPNNYPYCEASCDERRSMASQMPSSTAAVFSQTALQLNRAAEEGVFLSYDFAQMFRHTLGLYRRLCAGTFAPCEEVVLLNCLWMPTELDANGTDAVLSEKLHEAWGKAKEEFGRFVGYMDDAVKLIERESGVGFSIHLCSHTDLISAIDWIDRSDERELLKRYW